MVSVHKDLTKHVEQLRSHERVINDLSVSVAIKHFYFFLFCLTRSMYIIYPLQQIQLHDTLTHMKIPDLFPFHQRDSAWRTNILAGWFSGCRSGL